MDETGDVMVGRRKRPRAVRFLGALVVIALVGAATAYLVARAAPAEPQAQPPSPSPSESPSETPPEVPVTATAEAFLDAWADEKWVRLQSLTADQSLDAGEVHEQAHATLRITRATFSADPPVIDGDEATVEFDATWDLADLGPYEYEGSLELVRSDDTAMGWAVRWWYTTLHPDFAPDRRFERTRVFPRRAPILGAGGVPLATTHEVVVVGVDAARVDDPRDVAAALRQFTDATPGEVRAAVRRARSDRPGFFAVTEIEPARFESVRAQLFPVAGLVFDRQQRRQVHADAVTGIVGSLGEITAEQLDGLGAVYAVGDHVGQRGLEAALEQQLAGTPALEAAIVDDVGLVRSLGFRAGSDPQPVRTTLAPAAQRAAQRALRRAPSPAALVAIDTRTGGVRAAAYTPDDGFNRALSGLYPPGSTFKVVTSYGALAAGRRASTPVDCPARIRVADRFISNDAGGYGRVTLQRALAVSCNTTYARLGARLGADRMVRTAELFGFNRDIGFTLPAAEPLFPRPTSLAEITRASIGQADVQVSPLSMANVAATVASGRYRPPTLLADDPPPAGARLEPRARRDLVRMMRAVVTSGTGRAADLRGAPVAGKTGTAQFGSTTRTHAWFIGFRKNLSFAVVVEGAGHGGAVAAPVARDFLVGLRDG